jgi:hypothetical protein
MRLPASAWLCSFTCSTKQRRDLANFSKSQAFARGSIRLLSKIFPPRLRRVSPLVKVSLHFANRLITVEPAPPQMFDNRGAPSREAFVTRPRCWRCWLRRKWRRSPDWIQQVPDWLIAVLRFLYWDFGAEASREERHLEVNYELAARCRRHSQRNLTF